MLNTTRRKVLGLIGMAPIAAPIAVKAAGEARMMDLAGIGAHGVGGGPPGEAPSGNANREHGPAELKRLLGDLRLRRDLESMYYERYRRIGFIEPDLAVMRSFSLNAKITFQRQRMVAREIAEMEEESWWARHRKILDRARSFLG